MKNLDSIAFPCICFHESSKKLFYIEEKEWGLVSKGGEKFYKKLILIDSNGQKFKVTKFQEKGYTSFFECIKSLQLLRKFEVYVTVEDLVSFEEMKKIILEYLKVDKSFVNAKYSGTPVIQLLNEAKTKKELIEFVK